VHKEAWSGKKKTESIEKKRRGKDRYPYRKTHTKNNQFEMQGEAFVKRAVRGKKRDPSYPSQNVRLLRRGKVTFT